MSRSVDQLLKVNFLSKKAPASSKKITLSAKTSSFTFFLLICEVDILGQSFSFAFVSALAAHTRSLFRHSSSILIIPLIRYLSSIPITWLYQNTVFSPGSSSISSVNFFLCFSHFISVITA